MRIQPTDILIWVMCRNVLTTYARMLTNVQDNNEFYRFRNALIEEIKAIEPGVVDHELWKQATKAMIEEFAESLQGPNAYVLDRLKLWPH